MKNFQHLMRDYFQEILFTVQFWFTIKYKQEKSTIKMLQIQLLAIKAVRLKSGFVLVRFFHLWRKMYLHVTKYLFQECSKVSSYVVWRKLHLHYSQNENKIYNLFHNEIVFHNQQKMFILNRLRGESLRCMSDEHVLQLSLFISFQ